MASALGANRRQFANVTTRDVLTIGVAAAVGVALCLTVESALGFSVTSQSQPQAQAQKSCSFSSPEGPVPPGASPPGVEICVVPVASSPADDLLRSVLAALAGSLVGLGTFLAGRESQRRRRRRRAGTAVLAVIQELQANRASLNAAINPIPPGIVPPLATVSDVIFKALAVEIAERIPFALTATLFALYAQIAPLVNSDLRTQTSVDLLALRNRVQQLETGLAPYTTQS